MSLRSKTLLIISATLLALITLLYLSSHLIVMNSYLSLEHEIAERNLERVLNHLTDDFATLNAVARDWAYWDDTYAFVQGENPEYVNLNLIDASFISFDVNLLAMLDDNGQLVVTRAYDLQQGAPIPWPTSMTDYLQPTSPLLAPLGDGNAIQGMILLPENPLLVIAIPILKSNGSGPVGGVMIWGRYLDAHTHSRLEEMTRLNLNLFPLNQPLDPRLQTVVLQLHDPTNRVITPLDDQVTAAYALLTDLNGTGAALIEVQIDREVWSRGQNTVFYFMMALIAIGLIIGAIIYWLLEKWILSRIACLKTQMNLISADPNDTRTGLANAIEVNGDDEIKTLADEVNRMLKALYQARWQAEQNLITRAEILEERVEARTAELNEANLRLVDEIDERRKAQEALIVARDRALEGLRLKTQILANVSHDARTPLNVIMGYAEILEEQIHGNLTPKQSDVIKRIHANAAELLAFINNLLDSSQLEMNKVSLRPERFAISDLINALMAAMETRAVSRGLTLTVSVDADLPETIYNDFGRVKQILFNLVDNAIKFTLTGTIQVRLYWLPHDATRWAIQVADTGIGISPELREQIFEPFWQVDGTVTRRNNNGVGLGLSIVDQLCRLMNCEIQCESEVERGTKFTILIPFISEPVTEDLR
ncbi:MAG: ATP-binding protein [Anaerolineae bacterium]|nr:ATP-binding protein [Anaerolineae bacterium]